ncbi:MAG TPA: AAA family ATPase [Bacillus sp. (in: firmicutes)]|uniref:AAA family ATPase n=1 Tax=Bacillus litorisediminis TaxID=2922713 RepID=UPI001FAEEE97|nr:AAA family ATPase [Bacillus litorisediminis]HWO74477.1 AAA family ATPase [Bacillus sp. (in: firmicutes)]
MIIWINGTFGSGKSTTAYELQRRIRSSFVYDPERFGYVLMRNVPKEIAKSDFQDYPLWREANYQLLKQISQDYKGTIIVPMTLTNESYFNEIIGKLKNDGIEIKHYTLMATEQTIEKRLRQRFEGKKSWAYQQMEARLKSLASDFFKEQIVTDHMSVDEVVATIAKRSGVKLMPDRRTKIKKRVDRLIISLKEMGLLK